MYQFDKQALHKATQDMSMADAIELITNFLMSPKGYCITEEETNPVLAKFVASGKTAIDEEYGDKYLLNDEGIATLLPYIELMSCEFISFMIKHGKKCSKQEGATWFWQTYQLPDLETGVDILIYIAAKLYKYGYPCKEFHSKKTPEGYTIEES